MEISRRAALGLIGAGVGGSLVAAAVRMQRTRGAESAAPAGSIGDAAHATATLYLTANGQPTGRGAPPGAGQQGPGAPPQPPEHALYGATMDGRVERRIPTEFGGHAVLVHPTLRDTFLVTQKWGAKACVVDWSQNAVVQTLAAKSNCTFYGHGAFSESGDAAFFTESRTDDGAGFLSIRDPKTYALLGEIDLGGVGPHDCEPTADGKHLIIAITGKNMHYDESGKVISEALGKASIVIVELASGKIVERMVNPDDGLALSHVARSAVNPDVFFVATTPIDPKVSKRVGILMGTLGGSLRQLKAPDDVQARFVVETLSLAEHAPSGTMAVTCPLGRNVTFWDSKTGDYRGKLDSPAPTGICVSADGSSFLVSSQASGTLAMISPTTFQETPAERTVRVGNGSHLTKAQIDV